MKNFRYIMVAAVLIICMAFVTTKYTGPDVPVIRVLDGSAGQFKVDSIATVEDPRYPNAAISTYRVQNMVSLEINEDALIAMQTDTFTVTARLQITKTTPQGTQAPANVDLVIRYNKDQPYEQKRTIIFSGANKVQVKVIALSKTVAWDAFAVCKLVNLLQASPEYLFHCSNDAVKSVSHSIVNVQDELQVSWIPSAVADEYDLEWAYADSSALADSVYGIPSNPNPALLFTNNSSRVSVTGTSYTIPLFYDRKGFLFYRVRAVHWSSLLGAEGGRMESDWSSGFLPGGLGKYEFKGHEQKLNWQSSTSFAEEGKRKTVVQYYDGSLRSRQTVTKDNVTNRTIVAESLYDFQGRPVIQVMPAPSLNNVISYARNFNVAGGNTPYDKSIYDTLPDPSKYCDTLSVAMGTDSGASRYYSPRNPFANTDRKYRFVPDAEGFPFSEVEYTQDNTGRVTRQSGVGKTFRMGGGHETVYTYGTPDQKELDALFGTEVGYASFYQKTVVTDANGQSSISYTDMLNRTIATALTGSLPNTKMDTLSSMKTEVRRENLSGPDNTIVRDLVMESKKGMEVTDDDSVIFEYKLSPESLKLDGCDTTKFCYDCLYDLEITITSDCNNCKLPGNKPYITTVRNFSFNNIDTTCNPAGAFVVKFGLKLKKGSYDITKRLSVNRSALDYYRDSVFIRRNTCIDLNKYVIEQRALNSNLGECSPGCAGCLEIVGSWETYWANYRQKYNVTGADTAKHKEEAMRSHKEAIEACNALCGNASDDDDTRSLMLADVTPPMGQYANITNGKDTSKFSIFFYVGTSKASYQTTDYKDASGKTAMIYRASTGSTISPRDATINEFIANFQSSWADSLLRFHPEYCLLQKYELLAASHDWDRKVEKVASYAEAKAAGYLNPTGATGTPFNAYGGSTSGIDPFSQAMGGTFKPTLESFISNWNSKGFPLYGLVALSVMCKDGAGYTACENLYKSGIEFANSTTICEADRNMFWQSFRVFYLSKKKEMIMQWVRSQCSTAPSAKTLYDSAYVPRFAFNEMFEQNGLPTGASNMSEANAIKAAAMQQAQNFYNSNCEAYVNYWIKTLGASCTLYDTADLRQKVVPKLLEICRQGADMDHPYGSSSVAPSSTYQYKNFEEVIDEYNRQKNIKSNNCNAYVLISPKPYDQQEANSDKPVIGKPEDCECDLIKKYHTQFRNRGSQYVKFGKFMRDVYGTNISDSAADYLVTMCGNNAGACTYLTEPLVLPPAFQCNTGDICIDCDKFKTIDSSFRALYPEVMPFDDGSIPDSTQQSWNVLYEQYMNYKTGFAKKAKDYLDFAAQCQGKMRSPGCDSLNKILLAYQLQRKDSFAVVYSRTLPAGGVVTQKFRNPSEIVKDGLLRYPDLIRAQPNVGFNIDSLKASGSASFCGTQGYSVECRFKMLSIPTNGNLFYINGGRFKAAFSLNATGLRLDSIVTPHVASNISLSVIVDADRNALLSWCLVRIKVTPLLYQVYFNNKLVYSASRSASNPILNFQTLGAGFNTRNVVIDWYRYYDQTDALKYVEDFTNWQGYSIPSSGAFCVNPVSDCQAGFVSFFNSRNGNTNLNIGQIESLYLSKCGNALNVCGMVDSMRQTLDRFKKTLLPNRGVPVMFWEANTTTSDSINADPTRIIRDGVMQWEEKMQLNNTGEYAYHRITVPPGVVLCTNKGFSVEGRYKVSTDIWPATNDIFLFNNPGNGGGVVYRTPSGLFIRQVWLSNGTSDITTYPNIQLSSNPNDISQWNDYKIAYSNDSVRFYFNGAVKGAVKNPRNAVANSNIFHWGTYGYKGMLDRVMVYSGGKQVYAEDFNEPGNPAVFDPSFICSALPDCQTDFVTYFNQQRGTSYTFNQLDSLYYRKTGRSLDVCGTKDSLISLIKRYNNEVNPYRVSAQHSMNNTSLSHLGSTNKEFDFENGLFRWRDSLRNLNLYDAWWRYSNVGLPGLFCAGDGFTIEGKVKHLKNYNPVESFNILQNENFSIVFGTYSSGDKKGFNLHRIEMARNSPTGIVTERILQDPININSEVDFFSKQDHEFKVVETSSSITVYWNNKFVASANIPPEFSRPVNFNNVQIGFFGMHGAVDNFILRDAKGNKVLEDTYNDPNERPLMDPALFCPAPTGNCKTLFVNYFNQKKGTNYTYAKIDSVYYAMTGTWLNMCGEPPMAGPYHYSLCGRAAPAYFAINPDTTNQCTDTTFLIQSNAINRYQIALDSLRGRFDSAYRAQCLNAYKFESFTALRTVKEYHYTLYYYDQAGNLVKTIPPAGVRPNRDSVWLENVKTARVAGTVLIPNHELPTDYRYNALNQVVAQKSPDGGMSKFWYDRLGRLSISQNAKQRYASATEDNRLYSYTKYDTLGRIREVGQVKNLVSNKAMHDSISRKQSSLDVWLTALNQRREQITSTVYDLAYPGFIGGIDNSQIIRQRNLRNRVSYTTYSDGWNTANYNQGTFYTYDIHGNVDTLLQDYGCGTCSATEVFNLMNQNGNRFKKISYNYDLISGKVNSVAYQKGWSDQFFHRYSYDGENRLTQVETSLDGFVWDRDARYEYYLHGPLARTVLGQQQVQGIDYAYTLQGWLKGVNSAGATDSFDIGGDGRVSSSNKFIARDAFGFVLNYYGNDYKAIKDSLNPFPGYSSYLNDDFRPLYNGNISSMVSTNRMFENPAVYKDSATLLCNYKYDQLNRITGMDAFNKFNRRTNSYSALAIMQQFRERVKYDANGNILRYDRHSNGAITLMDSLYYDYYAGTNRLRRVRDSVLDASRYGAGANDKIVDIDHQTDLENYIYDSIGNLIQDKAEKISNISWNVYGKITGISRGAGVQVPASEIRYSYDASGNRISKSVEKGGNKSITWYVRDAQGNVMATYNSESTAATPLSGFALDQSERYIYGSSRLGVVTNTQPVDNGNAGPKKAVDTGGLFFRGMRMYELSNHLGNVLVTISDKKRGVADPLNAALIKFFEPYMLSGTDYYPFGMAMRVGGDKKYKYGFNGKENDNEVKGGDGLQQDYGMRVYDNRLGRFLSVDPLTSTFPWYSPFQFAGNSPVVFVDLDGQEPAKPLSKEAKAVVIVPQSAGASGFSFNDAYNAALKNPNVDVIKVNDVTHLNNELKATKKHYDQLIMMDHSGVSRQATTDGTGGQRIGKFTYNKKDTELFKEDFKGVGQAVKKKGSIILLGCMTAAPQYLGEDYLKTVAKVTNRKVFADQGETFIGPDFMSNRPLGGVPYQTDSHIYYYPVALANAGKWTSSTPAGIVTQIGNLKLDEKGNPSTSTEITDYNKKTSTNSSINNKKDVRKPQTSPQSNN